MHRADMSVRPRGAGGRCFRVNRHAGSRILGAQEDVMRAIPFVFGLLVLARPPIAAACERDDEDNDDDEAEVEADAAMPQLEQLRDRLDELNDRIDELRDRLAELPRGVNGPDGLDFDFDFDFDIDL
jgi:hypothetical protein